jgi:type II secretory pathway predicted ATPase ExeA
VKGEPNKTSCAKGNEMFLRSRTLAEQPFGVTPDAHLLCLGNPDRELLGLKLCGITAGQGFSSLNAHPGVGKTTFLWPLSQKTLDIGRSAFLFQSQCSPHERRKNAFSELAIADEGDNLVETHEKLNKTLVPESDSTKPLAVTLDDAQNVAEPTPAALRILSDFQTPAETIDTAHMGRALLMVLPSEKSRRTICFPCQKHSTLGAVAGRVVENLRTVNVGVVGGVLNQRV